MSNEKATDLEQVFNYFNPHRPLTGAALTYWFVARDNSPRGLMKVDLLLRQDRQKLLLIGHRGNGKTTELNKLIEDPQIRQKYHVVPFSVTEILGTTRIEYDDLMLVLGTQVTKSCLENNLVQANIIDRGREKWNGILGWWKQLWAGHRFEAPTTSYEISVQLKAILEFIEIGISQSPLDRDQIKDLVRRQLPELIRNLNLVIQEAEQSSQKQLLVIIEGLDKVDEGPAIDVFKNHQATITAPLATMIFSVPIVVRASDHYASICRVFKPYFFPNVVTYHYADGKRMRDDVGIAMMRTLVLNRMKPDLIEPAALDLAIDNSAGLPSALIQLVQLSAQYVLARGGNRIEMAAMMLAVRDLREDILSPALKDKDYAILADRYRDPSQPLAEGQEDLLYNGTLIEYANERTWYDAHPVFWPLLENNYGNITPTTGGTTTP
jgi:GTPase SAR1 family protein